MVKKTVWFLLALIAAFAGRVQIWDKGKYTPLEQQAKKADVEKAMKGHILTETQIFGLYQR